VSAEIDKLGPAIKLFKLSRASTRRCAAHENSINAAAKLIMKGESKTRKKEIGDFHDRCKYTILPKEKKKVKKRRHNQYNQNQDACEENLKGIAHKQ